MTGCTRDDGDGDGIRGLGGGDGCGAGGSRGSGGFGANRGAVICSCAVAQNSRRYQHHLWLHVTSPGHLCSHSVPSQNLLPIFVDAEQIPRL